MKARTSWLVAVLAVAACPGLVGADEAEDAFEALYGKPYREAKASLDRSDDGTLAVELVAAAKTAGTAPALRALLCEKAYEMGERHAGGYGAAADAMTVLAGLQPDRAAACLEKASSLRQRQYEATRGLDRATAGDTLVDSLLAAVDACEHAGDFQRACALCVQALTVARATQSHLVGLISQRSDDLKARQRVERRVEALKARLEANPDDAATRGDLVGLCLVDLDDPARAATFVGPSCEADLRKYVPAAAKGVEAAPALACFELAEWYRRLADRAKGASKTAMLERAGGYYRRFLSLDSIAGVQRSRATLALKQTEAMLAKLTPPKGDIGPGRWIDLIDLVDVSKDALEGPWSKRADGLRLDPATKFTRLAVPCVPVGDYELSVSFTRRGGVNAVGFILPVGRSATVLLFGHLAGRVHCLMGVSGAEAMPGELKNEKAYEVNVVVTCRGNKAQIQVKLDDVPLIRWQGMLSSLSVPKSHCLKDPRCLGFGSAHNLVNFASARLRMLSGRAKVLR